MAFTTVTGSNGVTSLVGTTGIDVATIVTLNDQVFVGGNTADDSLTIALAAGNFVATNYDVRMGGGDDTTILFNTLIDSVISLDGEILANDGNDTFTGAGSLIINSEVVGRGGNDTFTGVALNGSTLNGNTGDDNITLVATSASFVYGGQGTDIITTTAGALNGSSSTLINGNKGSDTITLAASGFSSGSVYGGNGNDVINAAAVTTAAALVLQTSDAGVLLSGDLGDDNITGTNGIDTINGGDGVDAIVAGTGADLIDGGAGNDAITGGAGGDAITGGAGNDVFTVANGDSQVTAGSPSTGFDTITDFVANTNSVAAGVNGDRINFATATGAYTAGAAPMVTGGVSLLADLTTAENAGGVAAGAFGGVNFDYMGVTITGAVAWAGNYLVYDANNDGAVTAADQIIKLNTLAGITAATTLNI